MRIPSKLDLELAMLARGWVVYTDGRLNICILRCTPGTLDLFDDMLCAWTSTSVMLAMRCTADPGKPSREHPSRRDGTAVWAEGQVVDGMVKGLHKGEYACLVPRIPIPVRRYLSVEDTHPTLSVSMSTQIHRANASRESAVVGAWSEGCPVVANPNDFAVLMAAIDDQITSKRTTFTVGCMSWPSSGTPPRPDLFALGDGYALVRGPDGTAVVHDIGGVHTGYTTLTKEAITWLWSAYRA